MTTAPAEVDTPVDRVSLEARSAVARDLRTAFRDSGVHAIPKIGMTTAASAVSLTIPLSGGKTSLFLVDGQLPAANPAAPLQHLLGQHGVQAKVTLVEFGPETALDVEVATYGDARRLTALVVERRSEAHDAAPRLRAAFTKIGITEDHIFVSNGAVQIGDINAPDAVTLLEILTDGDSTAALNELGLRDHWDAGCWREVEKLAQLLGSVVSEACGQYLESVPNPACHSCASSRPHRISLGTASPQHVLLLARAITTADNPGDYGDAAPSDV
ncbi:hypothetical protein AB0942_28645 [Streptomyces nodosus]|uniref:hypothetical protein n=1 Tax=Streptomyces nodosus TaxID=40318 RepID=UPI00345289D9